MLDNKLHWLKKFVPIDVTLPKPERSKAIKLLQLTKKSLGMADKFVKEVLSHLNLLSPGRVKNWIISRRCRRIEELFLDEYAFLENVDFLGQLFTSFEIAKVIGVTTLGNGTSNAQKFINNLSPSVIFTPWYECPNLNKNLEWERLGTVIKEPTINKDGDVAYNPEKWRLMISDWWTPTNEWYRKMCELMTPTFKQELNCKNDKRIFFW